MSRPYSYLLLASLAALTPVLGQDSIYIPGDIDATPGIAPINIGVGADGSTTYDVGGAQLVQNSASAVMTQYGSLGGVVYNCQLGADGQAACDVSQMYDGGVYAYTEPITYFGGGVPTAGVATTTTALPAATSTTALDPAATSTTALSVDSAASPSSNYPRTTATPSSAAATSATSAPANNNGPQPGAAQATASNVFGGNTGAASVSQVVGSVLPLLAAAAGAIMLL